MVAVISTPQATIGSVSLSVACPIADLGVVSLIPARSHTFVEIDREIFSME